MARQRLTGPLALLGLGAIMIGLPWLLAAAATHVTLRFNLASPDGLWAALTNPDDGTLVLWLLIIVGAIAWAILAAAIMIEIVSRLRHLPVPQLRGLALPQMLAHVLVAAAIAAVLASNNSSTALEAAAAPGPVPVDTGGEATARPATPAVNPRPAEAKQQVYVVKKGDTLWDIADDRLGDPRDYPKIFKASRHTVQPDGRHLVDPDLIYPGWKLTLPTDKPDRQGVPKPNNGADSETDKPKPAPTSSPTIPETTPSPVSTSAAAPSGSTETVEPSPDDGLLDEANEAAPLPWMLAGLAGAGALLAGGLWLWVRRGRAVQFQYRRPGRTITVPTQPGLAAVEKTLMHQGDLTSDLVERITQTTQRLAAGLNTAGKPIPRLLGVDATFDHLTLHFTEPVDFADPWRAGDDPRAWRLPADADLDLVGPWNEECEPVWPTLVTFGRDDRGWRLINLETIGVLNLTGDRTNAEDLVRAWLAELAVVPWARDIEIVGADLFREIDPLVARHLGVHRPADVISPLIEQATAHDQWLPHEAHQIDAARAAQSGPELWVPRILATGQANEGLDELIGLIEGRPGRTGVTVIRLAGADAPKIGTEVKVTEAGRVVVASLGLDLVANGITADEASGCAAVMKATEDPATDQPVPDLPEPAAAWQQYGDAAGHLHVDLTIPRSTVHTAVPATALLPDPDVVYETEAATTVEDLRELSPLVPTSSTVVVKGSDPTLDQDLLDWKADSIDRPRISVLGPVRLRLGRSGAPTAGLKRVPYYTEIVAYLATRPHGATAEELAEALGITTERVRRDLTIVRARLGTNPRTGYPHLPEAYDNTEARLRGVGVYLVEDLLCDAELFRRLRIRGEAAGAAGIDDLAAALQLVNGMPYEQLRRRGGLWLGRTHDDHHLVAGIIDVAHILTTHALATRDLKRARAATEIAQAVAPGDPTPQLDLARIAEHEGRPDEAARIAREITDWNDHSGYGPIDTSERANAILRAHRWLDRRDQAG